VQVRPVSRRAPKISAATGGRFSNRSSLYSYQGNIALDTEICRSLCRVTMFSSLVSESSDVLGEGLIRIVDLTRLKPARSPRPVLRTAPAALHRARYPTAPCTTAGKR
jgi:hypothetical protein